MPALLARAPLPPPPPAAPFPAQAPATDALRRARLRKRVSDECKKVSLCPWCAAINGQVKKVAGAQSFKIVHNRYKEAAKRELMGRADDAFRASFATALALSPEIGPHVRRAMEDLSPLRVKRLFARIRDEDLDLIWADRDYGRPEAMILTHLFVPPVAVRPSVQMEGGGGSNEDDLTVKLQEIVHMNTAVRVALQRGASARMLMENWDFLQVQVASFMNGELPGLPPAIKSKRPIRGLCQRLKGKQVRGGAAARRPTQRRMRPLARRCCVHAPPARLASRRRRPPAGPLPRQPVGQARRL